MIKFLQVILTSLIFCIVATGCRSSSPLASAISQHRDARPALWLVSDADTRIYLFGTVHVLKPNTHWQTDIFANAFSASDVLYQEADISADVQKHLSTSIPKLAFYPSNQKLMDALDEEQEVQMVRVAKRAGMSVKSLNKMRPWFAALALSQMQMSNSGYSTNHGVDTLLTRKAKQANKPIRYFETAFEQIQLLADLPEKNQIDFLVASANLMETNPQLLDQLVNHWEVGNLGAIAKLVNDDNVFGSKVVRQSLLTNRNKVWSGRITDLLDTQKGTFMIAVGAAHFAGDDSVIYFLNEAGKVVVRQQ
ncbi:MAG: TraB/GumN family protein [Robiginitomaculum sp.]|nr:TraB/GumN family protein [Robiginitomaculum sp.]